MGEALGICPSGPWHGRQRRADAPSPSPAAPTSLPKRIAPRGASAAPGRSGRRPFYPTGAALRVPIAPTLASAVSAGPAPRWSRPPKGPQAPRRPRQGTRPDCQLDTGAAGGSRPMALSCSLKPTRTRAPTPQEIKCRVSRRAYFT